MLNVEGNGALIAINYKQSIYIFHSVTAAFDIFRVKNISFYALHNTVGAGKRKCTHLKSINVHCCEILIFLSTLSAANFTGFENLKKIRSFKFQNFFKFKFSKLKTWFTANFKCSNLKKSTIL